MSGGALETVVTGDWGRCRREVETLLALAARKATRGREFRVRLSVEWDEKHMPSPAGASEGKTTVVSNLPRASLRDSQMGLNASKRRRPR